MFSKTGKKIHVQQTYVQNLVHITGNLYMVKHVPKVYLRLKVSIGYIALTIKI